MSNILEKRIGDLTDSDMKALEKPLGIPGRPYPMRERVQVDDGKGGTVMRRRLGVLESREHKFKIYSDRSYAEVMGIALREMASPGMLRLFYQAINLRSPRSKRRIQYLKGSAGVGKTHIAEVAARLGSKKGAVKIDCGNKNAAELLYETVLDFGGSHDLRDTIDRRLETGTLKNPMSAAILRDALGEAWAESRGKVSINWDMIGQNLRDPDQTEKDPGNRDYLESKKAVSIAIDALRQVSFLEGLEDLGANALGMATQEGPLIRAWREGREIILDEFNRVKKGTTSSLHTILQFIAGEIDYAVVENTLKEKGDQSKQRFVFRRADQKLGFFVTLTGNDEEDGNDVEELPESLNSRIIPQSVPMPTEEDWQHRICQFMAGLPVSTIVNADPVRSRADPERMRQRLVQMRTLGMTPEEIAETPDLEMQMRFLSRWEDVLEASEKLARFFYGWSQIVNPNSKLHKNGNLSQLLEEISERYSAQVSIDFRKIKPFINEAMMNGASTIGVNESQGYDDSDWNEPPVSLDHAGEEDIGLHFGDRLVNTIMNYMVETTADIGKTGIYQQLQQLAIDCGLQQEVLNDGKPGKSRSVADLLNDNPFRSNDPAVLAAMTRDIHCSRLRAEYPAIQASNDDMISVAAIMAAMERLDECENPPAERQLALFNTNRATVAQEPLRPAAILDAQTKLSSNDGSSAPLPQDLTSRTALLFALAAPIMRDRNLEALWARSFAQSGFFAGGGDGVPRDQSLAMADGDPEENLAVTSLMVSEMGHDGQSTQTPLHILWNRKSDRLVMIGTGAEPPELKQAFNSAGAFYIDRRDREAPAQAQAALGRLMGTERNRQESVLKTAFLMRATLGTVEQDRKSSLADLLVRRDTKVFLPVYIMEKPAARAA